MARFVTEIDASPRPVLTARRFPRLILIVIGIFVLGACAGSEEAATDDAAREEAAEGGATDGAAGDEATEESAQVEPVTLSAASFLPVDHDLVVPLNDWVDAVEEATDGRVVVEWGRGPESIPQFDQIDAVQSGVIDINFNVTAFYWDRDPALRAYPLSQLTPWEERESGFYDLMVERHKELGLFYAGRWLAEQPFYLWVQDRPESPDDLAGLKMRSGVIYDRFMKALGMTPTTIPTADVYTALESGLVEGFGWPIIGPVDLGWTDHVCCMIDHAIFPGQNATIIFNIDTWNSLNSDLQQIILGVTEEFERDMAAHFAEASQQQRERLEEAGIEFVEFSPEEAEEYVQRSFDVEWEAIDDEVPDLVDELRAVTSQ